jgi:hypothetical protein
MLAPSVERETAVHPAADAKKKLFAGMNVSVIGKFSMPQDKFKKMLAEYGANPLQKYVNMNDITNVQVFHMQQLI